MRATDPSGNSDVIELTIVVQEDLPATCTTEAPDGALWSSCLTVGNAHWFVGSDGTTRADFGMGINYG